MTRGVRGWLLAGIFVVVSVALVAMPAAAHAALALVHVNDSTTPVSVHAWGVTR